MALGRGVAFWHEVVRRKNESLRLSAVELEGDASWTAQRQLYSPTAWRALLAVPLADRNGAAVGSLQVVDPLEGEFSVLDERMLQQLARTSSVALENAQLYREARRATAARDDVLAMVSHDLRNPLAVVRMNASLLREDLSEESKGDGSARLLHLQRIERGASRMERLIADLLDASCIDAGALAVHPVSESAQSLQAEAAETGRMLAEARGCTLVVNGSPDDLQVMADRERVLQLFSNLIENSLRFIPAEGGRIVLGVEQRDGQARFSVRDNGCGMPSEQIGRLFDRFWRAEGAPGRGAGLGLFIARGIAEAHGGSIQAESRPSEGTTIRFQLPLAAV